MNAGDKIRVRGRGGNETTIEVGLVFDERVVQSFLDSGEWTLVDDAAGGAKPFDKMTAPELKAYAAEHEIDLGDAKKKADVLAAILAAEAGPGPTELGADGELAKAQADAGVGNDED